jgi:hypothetical protein
MQKQNIQEAPKAAATAILHQQHSDMSVLTIFIWLQLSTWELEEVRLAILHSTGHGTGHSMA